MDTIVSKNRSSHTYDEATARQLTETISNRYAGLFEVFSHRMQELARVAAN